MSDNRASRGRQAVGPAGLLFGAWLTACLVAACRSLPAPPPAGYAPATAALYTATGAIHGLTVDPAGRLWAATGGGVLCWPSGADAPRRWTVADGLPGDDARAVRAAPPGVDVTLSVGACCIGADGAVSPLPTAPGGISPLRQNGVSVPWPAPASSLGTVTASAEMGDSLYLATSLDLWRRQGGRWARVPLPPGSTGSHVSALCAVGPAVIAALYGDGLYRLTNGHWTRLPDAFPAAGAVTALVRAPDGLAAGTAGDGVWRRQGGQWRQLPDPRSLPSADIETLTSYGGSLWVGTLDAGLLQVNGTGLRRWTRADGLRSDSPRGLVVFDDRLYARATTGEVDCFDGSAWHPAFSRADLPRPEVYALASDGNRLCCGGWACWSATDGHVWERHEHDPELAGQVITAIAPAPDGSVWLGTQRAGLLRYRNGHYARYQEPQGLTDDWITCLTVAGTRVLAGTYTGGLLELRGARFVRLLDVQGFAIRSIALAPGSDRAVAATPLGVYQEDSGHGWTLLPPSRCGGLEAQAALPTPTGLWIGSRTGLAYVPLPLSADTVSSARSSSATASGVS